MGMVHTFVVTKYLLYLMILSNLFSKGEAGVRKVLQILRSELKRCMTLSGNMFSNESLCQNLILLNLISLRVRLSF